MKGIVFSSPMVKAWMERRKTLTRRLMKPQPGFDPPVDSTSDSFGRVWTVTNAQFKEYNDGPLSGWFLEIPGLSSGPYKPPYRPGETVYIRESCYICGSDSDGAPLADSPVAYRADGARKSDEHPYFRSPRFMPEWASRSHALIKSVRSERIQEITPDEAISEGIEPKYCCDGTECGCMGRPIDNSVDDFQDLWESLYPGSWERNDWVWRIELEAV